jgi:hypothetical protein
MSMEDSLAELLDAARARAELDFGAAPRPPDIPGLEIHRIALRGLSGPPPRPRQLPPPCDDATVDAAEATHGFALPPLLRRLYTEVANGGFGPGDGIIGLPGGWTDERGETVIDLYRSFGTIDEDVGTGPERLLPFCRLDVAVYDCIAADDQAGPIVEMDFDEVDFDEEEGWDEAFSPKVSSLEVWLRTWLESPPRQEQYDAMFARAAEEQSAQCVSPEEYSRVVEEWFRSQGLEPPTFD